VDTDRDKDIAMVEVQEENRQLVEEFYREKLGNRLPPEPEETPEQEQVNG